MNKTIIKNIFIVFVALFVGCSTPRALMDVRVNPKNITRDDFINKVRGIFVKNGYKIMEENKESGFIATKFDKQWTYKSGEFLETTIRLQIFANYRILSDGEIQIELTPNVKVKEVNTEFSFWNIASQVIGGIARSISGTLKEEDYGTDGYLFWYDEKDRDLTSFTLRSKDEPSRIIMLQSFLKVAEEIATDCGLTKDQLILNITK